ncbi:MAG TPA: endo-1,4-beta-xylanase, partial [bacterium]|nr:endo-1,4-beta-xylanase [bacterium]
DPRVKELTDPAIWAHRMGEMHIQTEPNAEVHVQQTRHDFGFGTALSTGMFKQDADESVRAKYFQLLIDNFNCAVIENAFKWHQAEPYQNDLHWTTVDAMLDFCDQHEMPLRGHCLFWAAEKYVPRWVKDISDEALREAIANRIRVTCERYRDRIGDYDVNNEMIDHHYFENRLGEEIHDEMFRMAHEVDPKATLYLNDYSILDGSHLDAYEKQIRGFLQRKVPVGGIGCQGHFLSPTFPSYERIMESLDRLARFGLPIKVTEFDREVDDEQQHARDLDAFFRICFSHPSVRAILQWGFWEGAHWKPKAALYRKDFSPKPAAEAYRNLVFNEWWSDCKATADSGGKCTVRVFYGHYTIETDGKTFSVDFPHQEKRKWLDLR